MVIGIDLNDVLRNFTMNFAKYYKQGYNHEFEYDDLDLWTNNLEALFPFKTKHTFEKFTYEDYAYELFGACPTCEMQLSAAFNDWVNDIIPNIDSKEPIDLVMVSPLEYGLSIPSTYFFLSKIACKVRKVFMPSDSYEIWEKCDVVITANPLLLDSKPENKVSVKITQDYNKENESDFEFNSFKDFAQDEEHTKQVIKKFESYE